MALTWEMGKNNVQPGYYESTFSVKNTGTHALNADWTIYFNQINPIFSAQTAADASLKIEWITSTCHKIVPTAHYQSLEPGETMKFTYRCRGSLTREAFAPEGAYIVMRDKKGNELTPQNIPIEVVPFTHSYQWSDSTEKFPYSDGKYVYEQNAFFSDSYKPDSTTIFLHPKSLVKSTRVSSFSKSVHLNYTSEFENEAVFIKEKLTAEFGCTVSENGETLVELKKLNTREKYPDEYYEISINNNNFNLAGVDAHGVFNACQTLINLLENAGNLLSRIANLRIADYPDMEHRGLMLDVARNFTKKGNVLKLIDLLSSYKLNERFKDSNILSYCWNTMPERGRDEVPYLLANGGYPIVLCNVTNFYLDMCYCSHASEKGLSWGGYVNEYNTFDMLPYDIYKSIRQNLKGEPVDIFAVSKAKLPLSKAACIQIKGLQAQIWAETIRSFDQVEYYLFPKIFGLVERAWNAQPDWSLSTNNQKYEKAKKEYNSQIAFYELPRLAKRGANFRVAQPGVIIRNDSLYANCTILEAVIRYTIDGSDPTENSIVWTKPIPCNAKQVKAQAFYLGKNSLTTVTDNEK